VARMSEATCGSGPRISLRSSGLLVLRCAAATGSWRMNTGAPRDAPYGKGFAVSIYLVAFVTGAIVMSFEMLGSRYLAPAFGAGIYTWASLISTVLAALCVGYFLGGYVADRHPSPNRLPATVAIGSVYLLLLPAFSDHV